MNISKTDLKQLYTVILENPIILEKFPCQFVIVENLPEYCVNPEHINKPIVCYFEEDKKTGLCLIVDSCDVETLPVMIKDNDKIPVYITDSIENTTGLNINPNVSVNRLVKMYQHTLELANKLCIRVPLVLISNPEQKRAERCTFIDDEDNPVGDIIYISLQSMPRMTNSLAHELRHCWQEYKGNNFYNHYQDINMDYSNAKKYINQIEEIDADAYAAMYLNSLGYDGIRMCFENDEEYHNPFWKKHIFMIEHRMEEISL